MLSTPGRIRRAIRRLRIAIPLVSRGIGACSTLVASGCAAPPPAVPPPRATSPIPVQPVAAAPPSPSQAQPLAQARRALFARVGQDGVPAIVREVRPAHVSSTAILTFGALPADFDAHGVSVRAATGRFDVLEMRALGTSPTMAGLLADHLGKRTRVRKGDEHAPWEEGVLVGVGSDRALVRVNGDVSSVELERVALVDAPAAPTLEAVVRGETADVDVELTYSTALLKSAVSYRLVRAIGTTHAWLDGYATIANETGVDFTQGSITLTADVPALRDFSQGAAAAAKGAPAADTAAIRFPSPLSVPSGRTVATRLFGPSEVTLTRRIVVEGPGLPIYAGSEPGEMGNASVRAVVDATTVSPGKLSPMGMLAGSTDLFEGDLQANDPPRWFGDTISRPLPGGVGLRTDLGDERHFEARRRLVSIKGLGRCVTDSSWEVVVTNPTEEAIPFEDVEPVSGDYVLLDSSLPAIAKERDYFGFGFPVDGKATVRLKFRVRVTSCVDTGRRGYWYAGGAKKANGKPMAK